MTNPARKLTAAPVAPEPSEETSPDTLSPGDVRQIDDLEAFINRTMAESGRKLDKVANKVFEILVDGDAEAALTARSGFSPKYDVLAARAGKTLQLDSGSLSRAVRIGALNRTLDDPRWSTLPWTLKVELLPLLGAERDFDRLHKGLAIATAPGSGRQALRDWVAQERSKGAPPKEPSALTPLKAGKLLALGARLQRIAERRDLAERVEGLDDDTRRAWMASLSMALRNLGKLHEEMTDTGEE